MLEDAFRVRYTLEFAKVCSRSDLIQAIAGVVEYSQVMTADESMSMIFRTTTYTKAGLITLIVSLVQQYKTPLDVIQRELGF
jgi:hypothetical protein